IGVQAAESRVGIQFSNDRVFASDDDEARAGSFETRCARMRFVAIPRLVQEKSDVKAGASARQAATARDGAGKVRFGNLAREKMSLHPGLTGRSGPKPTPRERRDDHSASHQDEALTLNPWCYCALPPTEQDSHVEDHETRKRGVKVPLLGYQQISRKINQGKRHYRQCRPPPVGVLQPGAPFPMPQPA